MCKSPGATQTAVDPFLLPTSPHFHSIFRAIFLAISPPTIGLLLLFADPALLVAVVVVAVVVVMVMGTC